MPRKKKVVQGDVTAEKASKRAADGDMSSASDSDSDSESDYIEDEDGELVTPAIDAQILRTLAEIRSRDSKIYNPEVKFFDEEELKKAEEEWVARKAAEGKKVTLTDYQRERLLSGKLFEEEENGEYEDEEYYEEEEDASRPLTHFEEQEELKKAFKKALATDEGDGEEEEGEEDAEGGLFTKRPKTAEQLAREEEDYRNFLLENLSKSANARESMSEWLSYKEGNGEKPVVADSEEQFLIDYVLNRGWVDQEKKNVPDYEKIIEEDEVDLDAVERAEEYETALNFRFEQPGAAQVQTFARNIEGSMRREESKRKEQRAAKKARIEAESEKRDEEIKRRKNEIKSELAKKLSKIQKVADLKGKRVEELDEALDLEDSDFDLEDHDKKMAKLFDDGFYDADDTEKPVFSSDDGEMEYPLGDSDEEDADQQMSFIPMDHAEEDSSSDHAEVADESEDEFKPKIIERPTESAKQKASKDEIAKLKDALYNLDCEDVIGRLGDPDAVKCRFRYTSVMPTSFGLEAREILAADDTLLNAHVSLKKLAPYRPMEKQRHEMKTLGDKRRVYMLRKKMWEQQMAEREERKKRKEEQRAAAKALLEERRAKKQSSKEAKSKSSKSKKSKKGSKE